MLGTWHKNVNKNHPLLLRAIPSAIPDFTGALLSSSQLGTDVFWFNAELLVNSLCDLQREDILDFMTI